MLWEGSLTTKNISPERDKQNPIVRYGGIDKAVGQIILVWAEIKHQKNLNTPKALALARGPGEICLAPFGVKRKWKKGRLLDSAAGQRNSLA